MVVYDVPMQVNRTAPKGNLAFADADPLTMNLSGKISVGAMIFRSAGLEGVGMVSTVADSSYSAELIPGSRIAVLDEPDKSDPDNKLIVFVFKIREDFAVKFTFSIVLGDLKAVLPCAIGAMMRFAIDHADEINKVAGI